MITIAPRSPAVTDSVSVSYEWTGCLIDGGLQRDGFLIDIYNNYSSICFATPPGGTRTVDLGTLPTGTYSVISRVLLDGHPTGQESASFVVGGGAQSIAAPTLNPTMLAGLAVALIVSVAAWRFWRSDQPR